MPFRVNGNLKEFSDPVRRGQISEDVLSYLRRHEPTASDPRSDDDLRPIVLGSVITANALGIRKLSGFKRFAYLWMLTDGQIAQSADAMDFIRYGGIDADSQVEVMLRIATQATAEVERKLEGAS
ncbi:MAG: hypothetical protein RLZZ437_1277 [Pseudomonadota bacterium]|jgi:hypothetical protein